MKNKIVVSARACCGRNRKPKTKNLLEQPTFVKNSLKLLTTLKDVKPSKLKNKTLIDYHMKTHMLYSGNIKRRPINKTFINTIVTLHDNFVKEMLKRKMKHNTPLNKV